MIIGITGKSGSGKGYVTDKFKEINKNIISIDVDKIGHTVLEKEEIKKSIVVAFGDIVLINNKISRKELGKIVFNSKEKMNLLKKITWNTMKEIIDNIIKDNKSKIIILDWALLPNTKYFKRNDFNILVTTSFEIRQNRAIKRDNISKNKFKEREKASLNYVDYNFKYVIENENKDIRKEILRIYEESIICR